MRDQVMLREETGGGGPRLDAFIYALDQKCPGLRRALGNDVPHSESLRDLIAQAKLTEPPGHDEPLSDSQASALEGLIRALEDLADSFRDLAPQYPNEPLPEPELHARSPL